MKINIIVQEDTAEKPEELVLSVTVRETDFSGEIAADFKQVNVQGAGPMWMFAVTNISEEAYIKSRVHIASLFSMAMEEIQVFFKRNYSYNLTEHILIDHTDTLL